MRLSGDGSIDVSADGSVQVQFQVPTMTAEFGTHKVTVTTDITVLNDDLPPGSLYKKGGYLYDGNGNNNTTDDPRVTGLEVAAGATLFDNTFTWTLAVNRDIVIAGTVSLDHGTMDEITLESRNGSIWIKPTGVLTNEASGQGGGTGDTGGTGGDVGLYTDFFVGDFTSASDIHADGGNGVATGGDGGSILYIWDTYDITGDVTYSGGTGAVAGTVGVFEPS